jgi:putative endonuclease
MDERRILGNTGEQMAVDYLKEKGYCIRDLQYRTPFGEIDIVAQEKEEIVFIEVKLRQSLISGYPEESVTPQKLRRIALAAQVYLEKNHQQNSPYRLDVIGIFLFNGSVQIHHILSVDMDGNS